MLLLGNSFIVVLLIFSRASAYRNMDVLVLDGGSGLVKAGFAGDESPRAVFAPLGDTYSMYLDFLNNVTYDKVGEVKALWNFTFIQELKVSAENWAVLLTEKPKNPREKRQRMAEIMFNDFNVQGLYIANQAWLALYATNRSTGIVLDSGFAVTYAVPIVQGEILHHAIMRLDIGARDLTDYMIKMMDKKATIDRETADLIKDELCYVALDFEQEIQSASSSSSLEKSFELPDGRVVSIGNERIRCPEALFKPAFLRYAFGGVHEMVYNSIMECSINQRYSLFNDIVLSGIATAFPGIGERMTKEITALAPQSMKVNVRALPWRKYLPWIGGSKFASEEAFKNKLISKEKYSEYGSSIIK